MTQTAYPTTRTNSDAWNLWRQQVVSVIRADFPEVLQDVVDDDIDWEAWRPLYDDGYAPQAAVDQAFERSAAV